MQEILNILQRMPLWLIGLWIVAIIYIVVLVKLTSGFARNEQIDTS